MDQKVLQVDNLSIEGDAHGEIALLVNKISFTLSKGEILGLTGASGSGKSLTALSLMGLTSFYDNLRVDGKILFNGQDMLSKDEDKLSKIRGKDISLVLQQPDTALNPLISCGNQLKEAIKIHQPKISKNDLKQKCHDLLLEVGLQDTTRIMRSYPHQISGGQLQRLVIAMAIAHRPSVIICDEITSALDTTTAQSIIHLLLSIRHQHKTSILFITHDLTLLRQIAHRILMIQSGTLIDDFENDAKSISSLSDYTKNYLQRAELNGQREAIQKDKECILDIHSISKTYSKDGFSSWWKNESTQILKDVSLRIHEGEMIGICGVSGSGKTTLGKIIVGLLSQDSGHIMFKNKKLDCDLFENDKTIRKQIQMVFQDALGSLNPLQNIRTIWEEVIHLNPNNNSKEDTIDTLLKDLDLDVQILNKYAHMLSGGQRQRVVLGRILLTQPKVIVFDEALSALDIINQKNIVDLIIRLQEKWGFSGIFISHDEKLVKVLCHRVYTIKGGELV